MGPRYGMEELRRTKVTKYNEYKNEHLKLFTRKMTMISVYKLQNE